MRTTHDEIGVVDQFEAQNEGGPWFRVWIVKGLSCLGSVGAFGFIIPQLAAEGANFRSPEDAVAAAMRILLCIIVGILLGLLGIVL